MAVFRVNKTKDYTIMSNDHLRNKEMSLKAKGLLSIMLSLPDDWDYSVEGLAAICSESSTTLRGVLKELEELGYLVRDRVQNEKGQFEYVYNIYEQPYTQKPHTVLPHTVEPHTENYRQLNTNISNTNKLNTNNKENKKRNQFYPPTLEEVEKYIKDFDLNVDAQKFMDYFEATDWVDSKGNKVKSWKGKLQTWSSYRVKPKVEEPPKDDVWDKFMKGETNDKDGVYDTD